MFFLKFLVIAFLKMSQTHPDFFLLSNSPLKKEGKTPL
jgi:hypothetical protein